jgi:hypothetical protein
VPAQLVLEAKNNSAFFFHASWMLWLPLLSQYRTHAIAGEPDAAALWQSLNKTVVSHLQSELGGDELQHGG